MQGRCVTEVLFSRQTRATVGDICWSWGAFEGAAEPGVTLMWQTTGLEYFLATAPYMQKTCDVAEKAILAKKKLRKKCVNRDKM